MNIRCNWCGVISTGVHFCVDKTRGEAALAKMGRTDTEDSSTIHCACVKTFTWFGADYGGMHAFVLEHAPHVLDGGPTRFAVRPGGERPLILGVDGRHVFKEGHVYEVVVAVGDEFVLRDLGESCAALEKDGLAWSRDANCLIREGRYLLTVAEHQNRELSRMGQGTYRPPIPMPTKLCPHCSHPAHGTHVCGFESEPGTLAGYTCLCRGVGREPVIPVEPFLPRCKEAALVPGGTVYCELPLGHAGAHTRSSRDGLSTAWEDTPVAGRCTEPGCGRFAIQDNRCEDHPPLVFPQETTCSGCGHVTHGTKRCGYEPDNGNYVCICTGPSVAAFAILHDSTKRFANGAENSEALTCTLCNHPTHPFGDCGVQREGTQCGCRGFAKDESPLCPICDGPAGMDGGLCIHCQLNT